MASKPLLRYGATGSAVVELQQRLNVARGAASPALNPDGIFGPKTLARVRTFQAQGVPVLSADGIVGPITWGKLLAATQGDITMVASQIRAQSGSSPLPLAHLITLAMTQAGSRGDRK